MKRIVYFLVIIVSSMMQASIFHKAIPYLDIPGSKAAARSAVFGISNVDLSKLAIDYWNHLRTGEGDYYLYYLISDETLKNGYKRYGLTADDVGKIQHFLLKFKMYSKTEEFAFSVLPKWLQDEYKNEQNLIEDHFILDDSVEKPFDLKFLNYGKSYLGYIVQEYYKAKVGHKKYVYTKTGYAVSKEDLKKKKAEYLEILQNTKSGFVPIKAFENNQKVSGYTHIVFPVNDINNQSSLDALKNALDHENGNPDAVIIIAFDDTTDFIPDNFQLQSFSSKNIAIKNLVIIGKSLHKIGNRFLQNYTFLKTIILPDELTQVGDNFMFGCRDLTSFIFPKMLTQVGDHFLSGCIGLISLVLPEGLIQVLNNFLFGCVGLTSIVLPEELTQVGDYFMFGCRDLRIILLSCKLTQVGNYFLSRCTSLTTILLLDQLTTVGDNFLSECPNIQYLILSEKLYKKLENQNKLSSALIRACIRIDNPTIARALNKIFTQRNDIQQLYVLEGLFTQPSNWPDILVMKGLFSEILKSLNIGQINKLLESLSAIKSNDENDKEQGSLKYFLSSIIKIREKNKNNY